MLFCDFSMNAETRKSIYRNKDFLLLMQGKFVSNLGNAIHRIAVIWYIISLVGEGKSGLYLALFSGCALIPIIFMGPLSGVYVDRINRKFIIVGSDILSGCLLLLLALFSYIDFFPFLNLFAISTLCALLGAFFNPAASAVLPSIVRAENLIKANSYDGMILRITLIIGAAIAGLLYHKLGIIGIFCLNGVSFILSGISEMFINIPRLKTSKNKKEHHFWREFKEGIHFIKNDKSLYILLIYSLLASFLIAPVFIIILPQVIKFTLKLSVVNLGQLESIASLGALLGMIIIAKIPNKLNLYCKLFGISIFIRPLVLTIFGCFIIPAVIGLYSTYTTFYILCFIIFIIMILCSIIGVPMQTAFQNKTPDKMRGRFFSIYSTAMACSVPLGNAIIGFLSDYLHFSTLIIAVTLLEAFLVIAVIKFIDFRDLFSFLKE